LEFYMAKSDFSATQIAGLLVTVARIAAWMLATVIVVLSIVPARLRPETELPHALEHFAIFVVTGLAFGIGYERRLGELALWLVGFDGAVEIAQLFASGRHARFSDFIVDAAATTIGVMCAAAANRVLSGVGT
jgi:VanZ family protein